MFNRRETYRGNSQKPVAWVAGWRVTKTLKPIDNVSAGGGESPGRNDSESAPANAIRAIGKATTRKLCLVAVAVSFMPTDTEALVLYVSDSKSNVPQIVSLERIFTAELLNDIRRAGFRAGVHEPYTSRESHQDRWCMIPRSRQGGFHPFGMELVSIWASYPLGVARRVRCGTAS
jgi:hypothetical protein